jgi:predicted RNase H-like HicB family nuclease
MIVGMKRETFTAYVEQDPETGFYVGVIPGLPGAHTQAATLDELRGNLEEVLTLVLEAHAARGEAVDVPPFVGIQQVTVSR